MAQDTSKLTIRGTAHLFGHRHKTKGKTWYSYSLTVSKKGESDEWINGFLPVRFAKDADPHLDGPFEFVIGNGFFAVDAYEKDGDQKKTVSVVITDGEIVEDD